MKINWEHTRQIEKYLDEELTPAERISFEAELSRDATLRSEVEFHKKLRSNIEFYGERTRLKRKMSTWHEEKKSSAKQTRFSKINWRTVGMAASFSLVLVTGAIVTYHFINQNNLEKKLGPIVLSAVEETASRNAAAAENTTEEETTVAPTPSNVATAFAISKDGYMLTAFHVVGGKRELTVEQFTPDKIKVSYKAHVVRVDEQLDIAVIKIDDTTFTGFKQIPFVFTTQPLELAQHVYSVGYPMKKDLVFNEGSVSGLTGYASDTASCQVNIVANPGNSGSPVMNEKGELVGVLLSKNMETEGETYVTRTELIKQFISDMSRKQKYESLKLTGRSPLRGLSVPNQVKNVSPYIFIVRTH